MRFEIGEQVQFDDGFLLPICGLCWNQLTVADRLRIAAEVRKQVSIDRIADAVADVLRAEAESRRANYFGAN